MSEEHVEVNEIGEWTCEYGMFRRDNGWKTVDVEVSDESLDIDIDENGACYSRVRTGCSVPLEVVAELMRRRGWKVIPPIP